MPKWQTPLEDVPSYKWFGNESDDIEYSESLFIGYRYYDTYHVKVRYPFGHGLSYTSFEYLNLTIGQNSYSGGELEVSFTIRNIGEREGKEITQLYVRNPDCNYLRPIKELRGFQKIHLKKGEEKQVKILLTERSFSIYDEERKSFIVPSGRYGILIGASSTDIRLQTDLPVIGINYKRDDKKKLMEPELFMIIH